MRILLLAQFFPPDIGGEELHVFNLAHALAGRGHEVAVATQCMADVPDKEILPSGVRVHRFRTMAMSLPGVYATSRMHHLPIPDPLGMRGLASIVQRERPEVIHAHNWIVNSALALRRRTSMGKKIGLVLTLHDFSHVCPTKRLMRRGSPCQGPSVTRCLPCVTAHYGPIVGPVTAAGTLAMLPWKNRAIDHVISVSRAVADGNGVANRPNSSVIPNFIPDAAVVTSDASGMPGSTVGSGLPVQPFLFFAGDLCREKGVHSLLRAYESLGRQRPPLLLVGRQRPDTPTELPERAEIRFDWPHEHVMAAFRQCLMAVLPSVWPDPCPTTVLEAMASGRPVITTSSGGIVDLVVDGESGLLVAPDNERGLAAAMARVLSNDALRLRLASGASERALLFTSSAVVKRVENVYAEVAGRCQGV